MKHEDFEDIELPYVERWVKADTKDSVAHVL